MKLFLDTNVLIDLLTERDPFYEDVLTLFSFCSINQITLATNSACMATASYYADKLYSLEILTAKMQTLNRLCPVISMNQNQMSMVFSDSFIDFEDAIQYQSALDALCTHIITRDKTGFIKGTLPFVTVKQFILEYI